MALLKTKGVCNFSLLGTDLSFQFLEAMKQAQLDEIWTRVSKESLILRRLRPHVNLCPYEVQHSIWLSADGSIPSPL